MDIWKGIVLGIGLWISCSFANFVQAQVKPASIFEIGKEISCCEDNFYNLFRNWDKRNIRNADSIRLLSYEYVGIVDNRSMVRMYADLMSSWDYPLAGGSAGKSSRTDASGKEVVESYYEVNLGILLDQLEQARRSGIKEELYMREFLKMRMALRETYRMTIPVGAKVYKLYMEQAGKKYSIFLFFDPETSRLTTDNLFSNIPLENIKAKNVLDGIAEETVRGDSFWKKQLVVPMKSQDIIWEQSKLRLKGYTEKYVIETDEQLLALEKELTGQESLFPVMKSSGKNELLLKTVSEIQKTGMDAYNFEALEKKLDCLLSVGMKVIELQWEYRGQEVKTLCVADDFMGVIYEPLFSHVAATPSYRQTWMQSEDDKNLMRGELFEVKVNSLLGDEMISYTFNIKELGKGSGLGRSIENNGLVYIHGLNGKIEFSNQEVDKWIKTQKGKIDFIWFLTTGGKELPVSRDKNGKFSFPDNDYFPYVSVVSGTLSLEKKQK